MYKQVSGQKVNKQRSFSYTIASPPRCAIINSCTGISQDCMPFKCLGVPILENMDIDTHTDTYSDMETDTGHGLFWKIENTDTTITPKKYNYKYIIRLFNKVNYT